MSRGLTPRKSRYIDVPVEAPAIIIPESPIWTEQPPAGTPLNKRHPLYGNIVGAWHLNQEVGPVPDLSYHGSHPGTPATNPGGGTNNCTLEQLPDGFLHSGVMGWSFDGSDDCIDLGTIPTSSPLQGGEAILAVVHNAGTGDNWRRIFDKSDGGGAANGFALVLGSSTDVVLEVYVRSASATSQHPTWAELDTPHVSHSAELEGGAVCVLGTAPLVYGTGQKGEYYWDGKSARVKDSSPVEDDDFVSRHSATQTNARIGSWNHTTGREFNGHIALVVVLDVAVGEEQAKQLTQSPWQLFGR